MKSDGAEPLGDMGNASCRVDPLKCGIMRLHISRIQVLEYDGKNVIGKVEKDLARCRRVIHRRPENRTGHLGVIGARTAARKASHSTAFGVRMQDGWTAVTNRKRD